MRKAILGATGIEVTELCIGALPMGPLQANIPAETAIDLLKTAFASGINFVDTAELYSTQKYVGEALKGAPGKIVVATKSASETYAAMEESVQRSLAELAVSQIDIYHLHAARVTPSVFKDREGALACLHDYKKKGIIRAVGISTHAVDVVRAAAGRDDIDIVFPLINKTGMGIIGGTAAEMTAAIGAVADSGKGMYAMKALAGGHLIDDIQAAYDYVREIRGIQAVAVGMVNKNELDTNVRFFSGVAVPPERLRVTDKKQKKLLVSHFCQGCGQCVAACPNQALSLVDGKAVVDTKKCLLCGYCSPGCPQFAIRLI